MSPSPASGLHVLVVDADPTARERYRRALQSSGYTVREAVSGVAAVVAARAETPDVVVMDMQLPDVRGEEAVEWLRALPGGQRTPLITLSLRSGSPEAGGSISGPVLALIKPVSKRALQQAIDRALAGGDPGSLEHRGRDG